ncbi:MAG: hypothetical protein ACNI3H_15120 [Halarcobacter ebronensis]
MGSGFTKEIKDNEFFSGRDSRNKFVAEFFTIISGLFKKNSMNEDNH